MARTEIDHHGAIDDSDPLDEIRTGLFRSARQDLATRQLHGLEPITTHSIPERDTSPRTAAEPEHDDDIDLG